MTNKKEIGFKFEPIWVSIINLLVIWILYGTVSTFIEKPSYDIFGLFFLLIPTMLSYSVLPMGIKMLQGKPALHLTKEYLLSNVLNVKIDWEDIKHIELSGPLKSVLSIHFKDSDKFYFELNPIKRGLFKTFFLLDKGDITINLELVKGDNKKIATIVKLYHQNQIIY